VHINREKRCTVPGVADTLPRPLARNSGRRAITRVGQLTAIAGAWRRISIGTALEPNHWAVESNGGNAQIKSKKQKVRGTRGVKKKQGHYLWASPPQRGTARRRPRCQMTPSLSLLNWGPGIYPHFNLHSKLMRKGVVLV
jgi:hypothetical protein